MMMMMMKIENENNIASFLVRVEGKCVDKRHTKRKAKIFDFN